MKILFFLSAAILVACSPASRQTNQVDADIKTGLSDEELMDLVQERTFRYFWDGAEHNSGMALERYHEDGVYTREDDEQIVTTGGSGFGIMAIISGIERGYITRQEGVDRLGQITDFLSSADRFHGVWPHWLNGETGKVRPFSARDDGADIVETSLLIQGLLTARQYLLKGDEREQNIAARIDTMWREVQWDWHTQGENVLYWHWSPNHEWAMNHQIRGYNESLVTYVLAASSPTYPISPEVYHEGWARDGEMKHTTTKHGYTLTMRHNRGGEYGGPLFWAHYSFLGLDPRNLVDRYADYWEHNVNHTLLNRAYCIENPNGFKGYGENSWGLTSSYSVSGYTAHSPQNDRGVITPTAALSSIPYTPEYSLQAMRYFYEELGDRLFGKYGFYDAFSETEDWFLPRYLAIDQGPIVVMIENYRSGLLWDLFMSSPEIAAGLEKLGFTSY